MQVSQNARPQRVGVGTGCQATMKLAAADVSGIVLPGCGHFVLEECPLEVTTQLETFFK